MKKLIWTYGLIGGLITTAWGNVGVRLLPDGVSQDMQILAGYTSMIVAFSLIFVAIKNYRDNFADGYISFGKALRIGLLITLVASTIYVAVWLTSYYFFNPNFFEKYIAITRHEMQATGKSVTAINQKIAEMNQYKEMYRNPVFNILMTYSEILPVGVVISLIAALILKNKPKPVTAGA